MGKVHHDARGDELLNTVVPPSIAWPLKEPVRTLHGIIVGVEGSCILSPALFSQGNSRPDRDVVFSRRGALLPRPVVISFLSSWRWGMGKLEGKVAVSNRVGAKYRPCDGVEAGRRRRAYRGQCANQSAEAEAVAREAQGIGVEGPSRSLPISARGAEVERRWPPRHSRSSVESTF